MDEIKSHLPEEPHDEVFPSMTNSGREPQMG